MWCSVRANEVVVLPEFVGGMPSAEGLAYDGLCPTCRVFLLGLIGEIRAIEKLGFDSFVRTLVEVPSPLTVEYIESQLVLCASCAGYLEESGRYETRDVIVPECMALVHMLRKALPDGEAQVLRIAREHPVPWVRYYTASAIERDYPSESCAVYKELQLVGGILSASALLAERFLAQSRH